MSTDLITGSFVALITPMNADGSVDFEGFRTLIQFHEENGTSAILFMASDLSSGITGQALDVNCGEYKA